MNWGSARILAATGAAAAVLLVTGCASAPAPENVDDATAAAATQDMVATINDLTDTLGPGWELPDGQPATSITVTDLDEGECQGKTALGTADQDPKGFYDQAYLSNDTLTITAEVKKQVRAVFQKHHLTTISEAQQSETTTRITATGADGTTPDVRLTFPADGAGPVTIEGFSLCHRA